MARRNNVLHQQNRNVKELYFWSRKSADSATRRRYDQMTFDLRFPGANRIRTCDPLRAKQMLSQLSYSPIRNTVLNEHGPGKI